jgi:hypothetical protein
MNRSKQIEIAFSKFLFFSRFGAQIGCPTDVFRTQNELGPAVDSLALILSGFESGCFKSYRIVRTT